LKYFPLCIDTNIVLVACMRTSDIVEVLLNITWSVCFVTLFRTFLRIMSVLLAIEAPYLPCVFLLFGSL
jgi:hypothetical protein